MSDVRQIGPHRIEIEGDLVVCRNQGLFTLEHMQQICVLFSELLEKNGRLFTITDASRGGDFDAAARRYAAEWSRDHQLAGTVVFGTSRIARVTISLMIRAIALLTRRPRPLVFVENEQQARAWVAEQREKLLASAPQK
jgi:hypothetical protein